ncbi:MAG: hypothetical protein HOO67_04870 [Candidatus Peribacteraceae bacterium]|nr:hypothetical protein [Candidatus Peribacteraceae bacterium]
MIDIVQYKEMFMSQIAPWLIVIIPFILIDLVLKALSMWRAARMNMTAWFIALFIVNSLGILPIIFLLLTNTEYKKRT